MQTKTIAAPQTFVLPPRAPVTAGELVPQPVAPLVAPPLPTQSAYVAALKEFAFVTSPFVACTLIGVAVATGVSRYVYLPDLVVGGFFGMIPGGIGSALLNSVLKRVRGREAVTPPAAVVPQLPPPAPPSA